MDSSGNYEKYLSPEQTTVSYRDIYATDGYPNLKAFYDFSARLENPEQYHLVCVNVDLRQASKVSREYGDNCLRQFALSLCGFYFFRIWAGKFNILVSDDELEELTDILDSNYTGIKVYYAVQDEPYSNDFEVIEAQRFKCIEQMYFNKTSKLRHENDGKAGDGVIGSTPVELRETSVKKYRKTMWQVNFKVTILKIHKEVMIYAFPLMRKSANESLPLLVVTDDMIEQEIYYNPNSLKTIVSIGGYKLNIIIRMSDDGQHLSPIIFAGRGSTEGDYRFETEIKEGCCFPSNFGKRLDDGRELYPVKKNITGACDYVLIDGTEAKYCTGDLTAYGQQYRVYLSEDFVELIPK